MIPSAINSDYPKFVPNQVLTSDNLNDLFGYLDEQQRITRTNLTGIGIVCGLQVKTGSDANGDYIIIMKGTGVTSAGYLVTVPEIKYHHYNKFDAVKCQYYDRFVNIGAKEQKMPLWELKQLGESETEDNPFKKLNNPAGFLNNKVVMLFVELLVTNNKNCDPNSCDDKGTTVQVNFRPLLVSKADAQNYLQGNAGESMQKIALGLSMLRMPRFDVESTLLLDTEDVFKAYQKVLSASFISSVRIALSEAWTKLNPIIIEDLPNDPFSDLESRFAFLHDGSMSEKQALNLQYFYDLFSDLLAAYDELKRKVFEVVCECVPDESLFPGHLLLGEAVGFNEMNSQFRSRFIASPVLCCCAGDASQVRLLLKRLALMLDNFSPEPAENEASRKKGTSVRITPSLHGKEPLSAKAIPFYYTPNKGSNPLYLAWSPDRTTRGTAHQNLSYHSSEYNTSDDFVKNPLKYDLEPHNFLRIEGHIGQDYRKVLSDLDKLKKNNRLPIDVIALSSDTRGIFNIIKALESMDTSGSMAAAFEILLKHPSCFADIFLSLDEWINKLRCCLLENKRYFNRLPAYKRAAVGTVGNRMAMKKDAAGNNITDPDDTIEKLYEERMKDGTINDKFCGDVFVEIATSKVHHATALVMMPYKIDGMIAVLPEHISQLDAKVLEAKYSDLSGTSTQLRNMYASGEVASTMPDVDMVQLSSRLEMNCLVCLFLELRLLVREFLLRLLGLMIRQKLGFYAYTNPGIQHKAGVTMGGTFILVYHETSETTREVNKKEYTHAFKTVNTRGGGTSAGIFSGDQPLLSSILLLEEILFLQKVAGIEDDPDEVLEEIISSIQPGTVIADFFLPYLCASDCAPSQMVVLPAPEKPNLPPVAKAGESVMIELPDNQVTLDGTSSSDPDGSIQTYKWTQDSGPGTAVIDNPDSATTLVSRLILGDYVFKLTVTDNDGAVDEDTVNVKVVEKPNVFPKAIASTDKPLVFLDTNAIARLIGEQSFDPDGSVESYAWLQKSGPTGGCSIESPAAPSTNVRFFQTGVYVFSLTVTDNRGASDSAEVTIVVMEPSNIPPTADAGEDRRVFLESGNDSFELDGSKSFDPEGGLLTYFWANAGGPSNPSIVKPDQPVTPVTNLQNGEYKFRLTVTDNKGAPANDTVSIVVEIKQDVIKTCGPLSDIINEFNDWNELVEKNPRFKKIFKSYGNVREYFQALSGIVNMPVDQQIDFFSDGFEGIAIQDLLIKWLNELQEIIKERKDLRLIALLLYKVLNLLAMYIVCIQKDDFDQAKIRMDGVFDLIRSHVEVWSDMIKEGLFSDEEKAVVKNIGNDIEAEIKRVKDNGEEASKSNYLVMLGKILSVIKSNP
jgi:hypothetical protein